MANSRENILGRIKEGLNRKVPKPFSEVEDKLPFFPSIDRDDLEVNFAQQFIDVGGKFSYCESMEVLIYKVERLLTKEKWNQVFCKEELLLATFKDFPGTINFKSPLSSCNVSITTCEALIARTGTIVISSQSPGGRLGDVFAPSHICIAFCSQVLEDSANALRKISHKYSTSYPTFLTFITGPSKTADIEKTLVVGVHGPKEIYCFLVED